MPRPLVSAFIKSNGRHVENQWTTDLWLSFAEQRKQIQYWHIQLQVDMMNLIANSCLFRHSNINIHLDPCLWLLDLANVNPTFTLIRALFHQPLQETSGSSDKCTTLFGLCQLWKKNSWYSVLLWQWDQVKTVRLPTTKSKQWAKTGSQYHTPISILNHA